MDNKILGILFDLDGVIVDSSEWNKMAFNNSLKHFGYDELTDEECVKTTGLNSYNQLRVIEELRDIQIKDIDRMIKVKRRFAHQYIHEHCKPSVRISVILDVLRKIKKVGLVTNCSTDSCVLILNKMKIADKFDTIITGSMVRYIKPHPQPYNFACKRIGIPAQNILVVEDSDTGVQSATSAGCRVWKLNSFDELTMGELTSKL